MANTLTSLEQVYVFSTHTWWMWPPSLGWLVPPCRVKKTSSQPVIPVSVSHFHILLFTHSLALSFSLPLILSPSHSLAHDPIFSRAWLAAASWRLPSEGPFVGTAFGGIKKGASNPPPPLLSPPPFVHPAALSSSRPHCLEREGAIGGERQKGREGIQMCENV